MFRSLRQAFKQAVRNNAMTVTSLFSITAMLLILGIFFILVVNVNLLTESTKQKFDTIEIFLLDETTEEQTNIMIDSLRSIEAVSEVSLVDKEAALQILKQRWGDNSYLLDGLQNNPLPNTITIKVNQIEDAGSVVEAAKQLQGVEDIKYYRDEVEKIMNIASGIQTGALIIILLLIIISIVVVSNTIKLTVLARGKEIMIMKYVGATNWFIRGPFLVEGVLIGTIASAFASGIIAVLYNNVVLALSEKAQLLMSMELVPVKFMAFNLVIIFLALGISIGTVGSIISMRRFLDR